MDEILIEDKKYVSSKRAAKVTGYAKDYVGQLCREGRVPARLVGRSWYVLESAIQDHRFGNEGIMPEKIEKLERIETPVAAPVKTWDAPRYEASITEALPTVIRQPEAPVEKVDMSQHLQDSWKAWFDRVAETPSVDLATLAESEQTEEERPALVVEEPVREEGTEKEIDEEVNIPIRTVYELPPEDLLPQRLVTVRPEEEVPLQREIMDGRGVLKGLQIGGAVFAALLAILAIIGTGYFDDYIISNGQGSSIAGVALYNK